VGAHNLAYQKRLYAQEFRLSDRAARLHAQTGHAQWVAFQTRLGTSTPALTVHHATAVVAPRVVAVPEDLPGELVDPQEVPAPAAMAKPRAQWTTGDWAEVKSWEAFVQASEQRMLALRRGDPMGAAGFVKLAAESLKAYQSARADRLRAEIESGSLRPASDFEELLALVQTVAAVVNNITSELPHQLMPQDPDTARRVLERWREQRLDPSIKTMRDGLAHILGTA